MLINGKFILFNLFILITDLFGFIEYSLIQSLNVKFTSIHLG